MSTQPFSILQPQTRNDGTESAADLQLTRIPTDQLSDQIEDVLMGHRSCSTTLYRTFQRINPVAKLWSNDGHMLFPSSLSCDESVFSETLVIAMYDTGKVRKALRSSSSSRMSKSQVSMFDASFSAQEARSIVSHLNSVLDRVCLTFDTDPLFWYNLDNLSSELHDIQLPPECGLRMGPRTNTQFVRRAPGSIIFLTLQFSRMMASEGSGELIVQSGDADGSSNFDHTDEEMTESLGRGKQDDTNQTASSSEESLLGAEEASSEKSLLAANEAPVRKSEMTFVKRRLSSPDSNHRPKRAR